MFTRDEYPLCRHTKTNGRRCSSPALATSAFCFHHHKLHQPRTIIVGAAPAMSRQVLHPLRDARGIQEALGMVANGLASGRLHTKQARLMLQAINMAAAENRRALKESRS